VSHSLVGETVRLRATEEPAEVLAVLDASGTLLVRVASDEEFAVARDDVETARERHACSCCG
jgi:hypothetical protein